MKLTVLLLTVAFLHVNANGYSQTITYSGKNVPLEKIFTVIKEQAGFGFIYFDEQLKGAKKVTINVKNATVENVLAICMKDQPYDYTIKAKTIFIINRQKKETADVKVTTEQQKGKRINISGRVTGEQGEPVVGATVTVKGTDVATSTNEKGVFYLNDVDEDAVLVVTYISYQAQEVALKGRSSLDVRLKIGGSDLDEAMVVAYNTTSRRMNTGAVSVVKGEQIATLPNRSFDRSLQGLVPGLLVTPGTGQPGGGNSNFVLRGIASNANPENGAVIRNPLIVIDGVPVSQESPQLYTGQWTTPISNPLAQLNPSDIESITVLKDAAAVALYGANSGNGVIIVTTKKGKSGKTRYNFKSQADISSATSTPQMLNKEQYLELLFETYKNTDPSKTDAAIIADLKTKFPTKADGSFYDQPDWKQALYTNSAQTLSNEISASGGSDRFTFYLNAEITKQNGIIKGTGFNRKSFRSNLEFRPTNWLKYGLNNTISQVEQKYGGSTGNNNDQYSENVSVFALSPLNPIYLENGNLYYIFQEGAYYNNANPVAISKLNLNRNNSFRGLSSLYGEVTVLKGVALKTIFGFDYMQNEGKEKTDPRLTDASLRFVSGGTGGRIEEGSTRQTNIISTNTARYAHSFGMKHNLSVMLGQEARILNKKLLTVGVTGITSPYYDQITSPGAQVYNYSGNVLKETLLSYFGQTSYDYNNKYFLTATIRRDGSSRFGKDERFGTYWSIGSGYIVSSEKFLAGLKKWLSYLKIRGSIGEAGNAGAIDRFTPYDRMTPTIYGGSTAVQTASSQSGNADVRWEKNVSWNIGLDLRLIGDRLIFTGDKYTRTTYDLIYQLPLPQTTGFKTILTNIGTMKNEGLELNVSGDIIRTKDFSWRISANWSKNTNKLVKASDDLVQSQSGYLAYNQVGQSFNSFYLKRWAGVDPATGLAQWVDSTGKPNSNYNAAKQEFVGKSQPDGFGSVITNFNYKGFELSAMFYYQYGNQLYNTTNLVTDGLLPYINESTQALNRWQKPGDQAPNPKRILGNPTGGSATFSTRNLFDGDHIRFQNLSLTYQFSPAIIKILHLSSLKVYAQGNNLKIWTKGSSYSDPSSANVYGGLYFSYPIQKSYSIGLNLGF